jgi:DNA-binding SARP family transcriptional activator
LVAPPGYGKTTAIVSYLRGRHEHAPYVSLEHGATAPEVIESIARACGDHSRRYEDLVRHLHDHAPPELALDFSGPPDADGVAVIRRLIDDLPDGTALLIASRSRTELDAGRLVSSGMASLCDATRLAFDADEIRRLADACGVAYNDVDVHRLLEACDGWPLVASSAIRKAAEDGCTLSGALENWRKRHGHFFSEFVTAALESAPVSLEETVRQLIAGAALHDQEQLRALEAEGLFVIRDRDEYRPLHSVAMARAQRRSGSQQRRIVAPLNAYLFGRFRAEIEERPVPWIRRRDQQIFKYLALSRTNSATRAELGQTFWPDAEKHLVAQSLRTACSNIRKAIARVCGYEYVDLYFRADHASVSLDPDNVIVDARRFLAHANDGLHQYDRNDLQTAYAHYRLADQVYTSELLAGEPAESWMTTYAAMLEGRYLMVTERLAELAVQLGDYGSAITYARRFADMVPDSESARHLLELAMREAHSAQVKTIPNPRKKTGAVTDAEALQARG